MGVVLLTLALFRMTAFAANITITSPASGNSSSSPVWIRAHNVGCNSLTPTGFGYTVDNSSTYHAGATNYDIDTTQSLSAGTHVIYFKSWVSSGACPVVSDTFSIGGSTTSSSSNGIPSYASATADLAGFSNWAWEHDYGTPGTSSGSVVYPVSVSPYSNVREFYMTYSDYGGERWHLTFGNNASSTHFALDMYVYIKDPEQVQNLELDLNQVMSNGETVMMNTQCSSVSNTWEYTYVSSGSDHWHPSNLYCNPKTWAANAWHHIQIGMHHDSSGYVTHDWVTLDGNQQQFSGAAGAGGQWLGWATGAVLTNLQIDGGYSSSGSVTAYAHNMIVYSW